MAQPPRPRIYLAGPEVFLPEAKAIGEAKAKLCADTGFVGIYPLDAGVDIAGVAPSEQAARIYRADVRLMHDCDAMIGNLTPFRGVSMDAGTAFEVGYMSAQTKPVLGYTNVAAPYRERATAFRAHGASGPEADRADVAIEDFELAENLMIEVAIIESGGTLIRSVVRPGEEMRDFSGFLRALDQARLLLTSHS